MLDKVTWTDSHHLKDNVDEEVAKLTAEEGGEIQIHGSGDLLQTLLKEGTFPRAPGLSKHYIPLPVLSSPCTNARADSSMAKWKLAE
jgi:hypothetical protein